MLCQLRVLKMRQVERHPMTNTELRELVMARQDELEELVDEALDLATALANNMDMALVAVPDAAPFITERANKLTEALRILYGRIARTADEYAIALKDTPHDKCDDPDCVFCNLDDNPK